MSTVDQLLFGYRDGHTLLAGSRALAPTQVRDVLPHIDASLDEGDESELVGTWIESLSAYLLARIWPAPEAERRGAVWAHALLLSVEQLQQENLGGLLELLRRPVSTEAAGYATPLEPPGPRELPWAPTPLARAIAWAALDGREEPTAVLWDTPSEAETALIGLLDALPGGARKEMGFRTRATAVRGGAYRLQVARTISQHVAQGTRVIDARQPPPEVPPAWTMLLCDGAVAARQRRFLRRYGDGEVRTREQTRVLLDIGTMLADQTEPGRIVQALVEGFPEPAAVVDLRRALVGPHATADGVWEVDEVERLELLCDYAGHFDLDALDIEQRLSHLAYSRPQAALRVVDHVRRTDRRKSPRPR
jgi:hypothetical protein